MKTWMKPTITALSVKVTASDGYVSGFELPKY